MDPPSNGQKQKRKRRVPFEMNWVQANYDEFSHILFFDFFKSYHKNNAIRRFKTIVKDWIKDDAKRQRLEANFKEWQNSDEAKKYWSEREVLSVSQETRTPSSSSSTTCTESSVTYSVVSDASKELEEHFKQNITLPDDSNSYIVEGINCSKPFYEFQQTILTQTKSELLTFETHCHELLALSSILLLSGNYPANMVSCFPANTPATLGSSLRADVGVGAYRFPRTPLMEVLDTVQSVTRSEMTRENASISLITLSMGLSGAAKKFVLMINKFIMQFPLENQLDPIQETDLCSRFLLPILQSLFDEQFEDRHVLVKLSNEKNLECQSSQFDISKRRPDGQIQMIPTQTSQISTVGFMEAKQVSECRNHSKINMDLIRLGIFGKNAIDTRDLDASMLIQAVGTNLTFYLMKRPTDDIYTMLELDHIRFPTSLNELKGIYGFVDNICDIMHVFSRECSGPKSREATSHRSSMKSPLLRAITCKTVDRKRKNSVQHYCL